MGIRVGRVSIEQNEDSAGRVWVEGIQDADTDWRDARYDLDFRLHLERFIIHTMAGSEAQKRFNSHGWLKGAGSEVQTLQWTQVDFERNRVYLAPGTTKNEEARWFPITEELHTILKVQLGKRNELKEQGKISPLVFSKNGRQIKSFYKAWRTTCKAAGVPGRLLHDFRRTGVRNIDRSGIPRTVAMKLTGHKTESVYRRYNIVSDRDLEQAGHYLDAVVTNIVTVGQNGN